MKLQNMKIATKIACIAVSLSIMALGYVVYLSGKMKDIDSRYSVLLDDDAQGALYLSRLNTRLEQIGYATYKALVYETGSPEERAAIANFKVGVEKALDNMRQAEGELPGKTRELANIRRQVEAVVKVSTEAMDFEQRDQNDQARQILTRLDPMIQKAFDDSTDLLKVVSDSTRAASKLMTAEVNTSSLTILAVAILVGLCGLLASLAMSAKAITGPLSRLQARMIDLAEGRLDVEVEGQTRGDEVGAMARAVQVFKTEGLRARKLEVEAADARQIAEQQRQLADAERRSNEEAQAAVVNGLAAGLARLSDGDLTIRVQDFPAEYRKLGDDFNAAVAKLEEVMSVIAGNGRLISSGTSEIAHAADDLSRRTEQQAASLEQTAAALDQITATVKTTAEGARHAKEVVSKAKAGAEESGDVVQRAVAAMGEIEKSAGQISQIITVIDEIAFQTNLLALNAGVEAARAGDAGRGFAVVASEVRALAQRSAEAAKEIKTLISTSSSQVANGVNLVGETGKALTRISDQVSEISTIVSEITASAVEQSSGLQEVNNAVNHMDEITQKNAAMVEQSTAASHSLKTEADQLNQLIGRFNVKDSGNVLPLATRSRPAAKAPSVRTVRTTASSGRSNGAAARQLEEPADDWREF